ncbi:2-oxoglutarate ferredoxin oxidoreductase subunit alpha [Natronincola peptidivorans]|uniref:2-oxoglutarate ferredoxin oxidoreductase subunit alpha n=1 Tax=Natronincola peptidivorans TaxID=426128 RepID=A0A1I0BQQ1_9FIRM|nr:2-oxoacid:acceptor oxidoreductase subunit alpha [Natronincola peptidivorans]SET09221.1 2-oxoglutarate ferredoxin oxidoreductase subunit alpha [Natronincola peptidivorans]
MKYNILIGGEAGQGMDTLAALLEKILKRQGYYVFSNKDYMSRIRGGHNFIQIRFGTETITSHHPALDVIVALDKNTIDLHKEKLQEEGVILCDAGIEVDDKRGMSLPLKEIAKDIGNTKVFGSIALGVVLRLFGLDINKAEEVFEEKFNQELSRRNLQALEKGYSLTDIKYHLDKAPEDQHIYINSNQAIALGALAGGVSFYSGYPMTPGTSIMTYLSGKQEDANIVVEQVEDEIAAINMAIGASYAGTRAMTGTSGGGFSLMVEALGLAGIMETPLVVANIQRPGPATGFPTRTEQGDLSFVLTASHGEIPRMVLAVRNAEDAFYQTVRALNIADKYQMLVVILGDQYLSDATETIQPFDFSNISIDRHIAGEEALQDGAYKRYRLTEDGLSPRIIPGKHEGQVVLVDSDEHNEEGHITESAEVRIQMVNKRMKRMEALKEELIEPNYFGVEKPEILLLGWGSMNGPLNEAVEILQKENIDVGALVFGDLYPLPTKLLEKYSGNAAQIINVEQNYTGQLAKLIRQETGIPCQKSILKYDGRQMSGYEIYKRVKEEVL